MNKNVKRLLKNLGIFTIANLLTKLLNFLILPLYTSFLSTADYGTIDLITTLIQLLFPIFTLAISDAVMRFGVSENKSIDEIIQIGFMQVAIGIIPVLILGVIYAFVSKSYVLGILFILIYAIEGFNTLFSNCAKAINKTKQMALISTFVSTVTLLSNVLLVAYYKAGITGYLSALLIGNVIGGILYLTIGGIRPYLGFNRGMFDSDLKVRMLAYSIPLIPNAVFWWINSSLDRWTLTVFSGVTVVGLYAVANKLPTIISNISTVFSQAWNLSLFQSKEEEQKKFFEKTYDYYNDIIFCCTVGIIALCKFYAIYGFKGDYFSAWKIVPILSLGVFYNSINAVLGSIFTANKDTKYIFSTTLVGSVTNLVLNIPFVICFSAIGAAIATAISYIVVFVLRIIKTTKMYQIQFNRRKIVLQYIIVTGICIATICDRYWVIVGSICVACCLWFAYKSIRIYKNNRSLKDH